MNSLLFKFLFTVLFIPAGLALGLSEFDSEDDDTIQNFINNTIIKMLAVPQVDIEDSSISYEDTEKSINKYLSDDVPSGDNVTDSKENIMLRSDNTATETPTTRRSIRQASTASPKSSLSEAKQRAHERRIREVSEHMAQHFMSTLYFYNEVKRIEKQHVVMDELRIMAVELEHPNKRWMKNEILKCFRIHTRPVAIDIWNKKTNNLVINIVQNSINDGVPI